MVHGINQFYCTTHHCIGRAWPAVFYYIIPNVGTGLDLSLVCVVSGLIHPCHALHPNWFSPDDLFRIFVVSVLIYHCYALFPFCPETFLSFTFNIDQYPQHFKTVNPFISRKLTVVFSLVELFSFFYHFIIIGFYTDVFFAVAGDLVSGQDKPIGGIQPGQVKPCPYILVWDYQEGRSSPAHTV